MVSRIDFTDDPGQFLAAVGPHLASEPVVTTVIATVTRRLAERGGDGAPYRWWAVARDEHEQVAGVAMRTAPFEPYPAYVLPMPDDAAVELARALHERGEELGGVNGALPSARLLAEEYARLSGGEVAVDEHLRLFELGDLEHGLVVDVVDRDLAVARDGVGRDAGCELHHPGAGVLLALLVEVYRDALERLLRGRVEHQAADGASRVLVADGDAVVAARSEPERH
jgi:hypothetical protein